MPDPFAPLRAQPTASTPSPSSPHRRRSTLRRQGVQPQDKASRLRRRMSGLQQQQQQQAGNTMLAHGFSPALNTSRAGTLRRAGQHFIVGNGEYGGGVRVPFLCLLNGKGARHDNPFYDVELDAKWSKPATVSFPMIVFGYSGPSANYFSIMGDYAAKTWSLRQHVTTGAENGLKHRVKLILLVPHTPPASGRSTKHANIFRSLFIQVRGASLSFDVDGDIIFTSLMLPVAPHTKLGTRVGVACAPGSSWIFRNFASQPKVVLKSTDKSSRQTSNSSETRRHPQHPSNNHLPPNAPSSTTATTAQRHAFPAPIAQHLGDPRLVRMIEQDMLETGNGATNAVSFRDIAGLAIAKRLLNEAVILPSLAPEVFVGIRESWRGVLMFGPPGTGKTMLARATAASSGITFINTSAATLVSKYRGESCKLVRTLFAVARARNPSVIFIDEIDALATRRGGVNEHEASRRLKSELLTCMDGLASATGDRVVVMATTNTPWDLDDALLRRLEKRIFVPLPDRAARTQLLQLLLNELTLAPDITSVEPLVARLEGFSCADIRMVIREAGMGPVRRMLEGKTGEDIAQLRKDGRLAHPGAVSLQDLVWALKSTRSSVAPDVSRKFAAWARQFAST
jgi:katanin p60 ATPase-containing subunit A1